jgi:hypothetical protein
MNPDRLTRKLNLHHVAVRLGDILSKVGYVQILGYC